LCTLPRSAYQQPGVAADLVDGSLSPPGVARTDVDGEPGGRELPRDLLADALSPTPIGQSASSPGVARTPRC
jgi:hypothetical protein